ncbi:MAG TPA: hypothetical protein PLX23_09870 [Candidatus Hydrogenedens sp.]|nr:hypothetical protein [Candidatus Hydrogenedens sp.]
MCYRDAYVTEIPVLLECLCYITQNNHIGYGIHLCALYGKEREYNVATLLKLLGVSVRYGLRRPTSKSQPRLYEVLIIY